MRYACRMDHEHYIYVDIRTAEVYASVASCTPLVCAECHDLLFGYQQFLVYWHPLRGVHADCPQPL